MGMKPPSTFFFSFLLLVGDLPHPVLAQAASGIFPYLLVSLMSHEHRISGQFLS